MRAQKRAPGSVTARVASAIVRHIYNHRFEPGAPFLAFRVRWARIIGVLDSLPVAVSSERRQVASSAITRRRITLTHRPALVLRHCLSQGLPAPHRVETTWLAVSLGSIQVLGEGQKPDSASEPRRCVRGDSFAFAGLVTGLVDRATIRTGR